MSKRTSAGGEPTPVPYAKITVLGLVLTSNNCAIWIIYTMLPFMVKFYFPHLSLKELGFRAGFLGSSFHVGALFGNFIWGIAADKYGRKPALVGGLFGTIIAALMFGFSPNYWFACFARFLWGFLNGNIGVSKTYMAEITDDSNNAKGMALYGVIGGFGRTVGPVLGGFLIEPALNYPDTFRGTIFDTFPFALPVTLVAVQCLITAALALRYLPETLKGSYFYVEAGETAYGPLSTSEHDVMLDGEGRGGRGTPSPPTLPGGGSGSGGGGSEARTQMERIMSEQSNAGAAKDTRDMLTGRSSSSSSLSSMSGKETGTGAPKRKKSVGFANIVMVKTIGSGSMAFGPLKRVMDDDVPVGEVRGAPIPQHDALTPPGYNRTSRDADTTDDLSAMEGGVTDGEDTNLTDVFDLEDDGEGDYHRGGGASSHLTLEDHPELTPIKGLGAVLGGSNKEHESPQANEPDSPTDTDGSPRDEASQPMLTASSSSSSSSSSSTRAPMNKLVFSNGAEFFSVGGAKAASSRGGNGSSSNGSAAGGGDSVDVSRGARGYIAMVAYLLSRRQILMATFMYGLNGFLTLMAAEIFPLWVVTAVEDGGFGYDSKMIGLCTMVTGPISIAGQLILYPHLVEKHGLIGTYRWAAKVFAIGVVCMPMVSLTNSWDMPHFTAALVIIMLGIINTTQMWVLISVFSFINNSCYSYQRATVNSIGQTFAAIGRLLAPYIGGVAFAWSETNGLSWPLDYAFTFYLVGTLAWFSGSLAGNFPRSIQRRKREPKTLRYAQPGLGGGLTEDELLDDYIGGKREMEMVMEMETEELELAKMGGMQRQPLPGVGVIEGLSPEDEDGDSGAGAIAPPMIVCPTAVAATSSSSNRKTLPGTITSTTTSNPLAAGQQGFVRV